MTDDDFNRTLALCDKVSEQSNDPHTQVGCVLVPRYGWPICGFNHTPKGVKLTEARCERPTKYDFVEHSERNAIYEAARMGIRLADATLYMQSIPCTECARAVVQSGIATLHYSAARQSAWASPKYNTFNTALAILTEGGVAVHVH